MIKKLLASTSLKIDSYNEVDFQGDPGSYYYKIISQNKDLFIKIYDQTRENDFNNEVVNYDLLSTKINNLPRRHSYSKQGEFSYIIYDFIDGESLYSKNNNGELNKKYYSTLIKNIAQIQSIIDSDLITQTTLEWFKKEFINNIQGISSVKSELYEAYKQVDHIVQDIVSKYPGIYSDRNPRNVLISNTGETFNIDFEVLFKCSPIFDLIKLTRNGTDFKETPDVFSEKLHIFSRQYELELFKKFIYDIYDNSEQKLSTTNAEHLSYIYDACCLFVHLLYVGYCSSELSRQENIIKYNRQKYHLLSAIDSIDKILNSGIGLEKSGLVNLQLLLKKVSLSQNGVLSLNK
jgi:thiamine kinase-like enzyme